MEEYVDVDINAWAKQIREMKIRELEEMIDDYNYGIKNPYEYSDPIRLIDILQHEIDKLQLKLDILKQ